jgi:alkyl hydroperoxide reductase subunit AhpC
MAPAANRKPAMPALPTPTEEIAMSLINTAVKPFKTTAFHNGKFVEVTDATLQGQVVGRDLHAGGLHLQLPDRSRRRGRALRRVPEAGAEVYIVTTDTHFSHKVWHETSPAVGKAQFPLVGDPTHALTRAFGVHIEEAKAWPCAAPSSSIPKA